MTPTQNTHQTARITGASPDGAALAHPFAQDGTPIVRSARGPAFLSKGVLASRLAIAAFVGMSALSATAQMTPVGLWKTISDKDGLVTSEVRIVESAGEVSGKVERILHPDAKPGEKCTLCKDERKDQLQLGMEIIRAAKKAEGKDVWEGGNILDPENGSVYRLKMTPVDGGKKLEIRGYIGTPIFGRTQTWFRVQ